METDEDVNMIWHPVHRQHFAALILYDPSDVFVNLFLMTWDNERLPAFNGEDKLNDYLVEGVRHLVALLQVIIGTADILQPEEQEAQGSFCKHTAPLGQDGRGAISSTNMLPRWGRTGGAWFLLQTCRPAGAGREGRDFFYKHAAPLGQDGRGVVSSTNMLPRWGRTGGARFLLQTCCPAGAGREGRGFFYKHAAPLGQDGRGVVSSTNMLPRWGRTGGAWFLLQTCCPAGAGREGRDFFYKHAAPLGQDGRGVVSSTNM